MKTRTRLYIGFGTQVKYAFPNDESGGITIALHRTESGKVALRVCDNGVGIPERIDIRNTQSLGMQLAHNLTAQLDGELQHDNEYGARIAIEFECERWENKEVHYAAV